MIFTYNIKIVCLVVVGAIKFSQRRHALIELCHTRLLFCYTTPAEQLSHSLYFLYSFVCLTRERGKGKFTAAAPT